MQNRCLLKVSKVLKFILVISRGLWYDIIPKENHSIILLNLMEAFIMLTFTGIYFGKHSFGQFPYLGQKSSLAFYVFSLYLFVYHAKDISLSDPSKAVCRRDYEYTGFFSGLPSFDICPFGACPSGPLLKSVKTVPPACTLGLFLPQSLASVYIC